MLDGRNLGTGILDQTAQPGVGDQSRIGTQVNRLHQIHPAENDTRIRLGGTQTDGHFFAGMQTHAGRANE